MHVTMSVDFAEQVSNQTDELLPGYYLESLSLSDDEKLGIIRAVRDGCPVDPVVSFIIGATNGNLYNHLIGKLDEYPIPTLRLPAVKSSSLLDIGCNWGRWSIAAAHKGYRVTGIDPQIGAVMAAKRVAKQLFISNRYIVGDARCLPFSNASFDVVFSYSVLQHLSKPDARTVISEIARVLKPGGTALIQMPTPYGLRTFYNQCRRRFREPTGFEVRFWTLPELRRAFSAIGKTSISVDCYFGTGLQPADLHLMPATLKAAIHISELLRKTSRVFPLLKYVADSVYVKAIKHQ